METRLNLQHTLKHSLFTMLDRYTSSRLNTEVKQHWAWIILGWVTLQGMSGGGSLSTACIGSLSSLRRYLSKKTNLA